MRKEKTRRRFVIAKFGAPDYETALKVENGNFPSHTLYLESLDMDISHYEDFLLMKELKEEEKTIE